MEIWKPAILGVCLIVGCGEIKQTVDGEVAVNVNLDFAELEKYFRPVCEEEYPVASEEQIEECINLKIGELLQTISG